MLQEGGGGGEAVGGEGVGGTSQLSAAKEISNAGSLCPVIINFESKHIEPNANIISKF